MSRGIRLRAQARSRAVSGLPLFWRTFAGIALLLAAANLAGAIVVALLQIALNGDVSPHQRLVVILVGAGYGVLAFLAGTLACFALQGRTLGWLVQERRPTRDEARRALRNPIDLAVLTGALWWLGAVVMGVVAPAIGATDRQVLSLCGGIVLAGLTTAGTTYSIASIVGRPITVRALEVYPPTETLALSLGHRLVLNWLLTSAVPLSGIVLILWVPGGHTHRVDAGIAAAAVALVVGALSSAMLSRRIARPLCNVAGALERVGHGDLAVSVDVDHLGEIGMVQRGVNQMVAGLRERQRIFDLFGRHVGAAVAEEAVSAGVRLGGESRDVVALFVDISGSTPLTRRMDPEEFVSLLNRFYAVVVDAVEGHGGLVNKFEGDAALCVFGAPTPVDDPSTAALAAAREIRDTVAARAEVDIGIGVACGSVIAGQVGTPTRLEYTVIGDAVNEAARLTELAKRVDGRILASSATVETASAEERRHWARGRIFRLRGRDTVTRTYRSVDATNPPRWSAFAALLGDQSDGQARSGTDGESDEPVVARSLG